MTRHNVLAIALCAVLLAAPAAQAATTAQVTLSFASAGFVGAQKIAQVQVLIDSSVPVNAYGLVVKYDPQKLSVSRVDTSKSIITIWQEPVGLSAGSVKLSGASQKAFSGTGGSLMTIYFKAVSSGVTDLDFTGVQVYQADGKGTPAVVAVRNASMNIAPEHIGPADQPTRPGQPVAPDVIDLGEAPDQTAPRITDMRVERNPFDPSVLLLVFSATDDQSSVVAAQVRTKTLFGWNRAQEAVSPYPLSPGAWLVELTVIDGAGNQATQTLYRYPLRAIVSIVIALMVATSLFVWIRRKSSVVS